MKKVFLVGAWLVGAAAVAACSGVVTSSLTDACTAGVTATCECGAATGLQVCGGNGSFLPCVCAPGGDAGRPDGASGCSNQETCAGKCGLLRDSCGVLVTCGECPAGETCGGGGAGVCGASACTPSCIGKACGESDGCAGLCASGACGPNLTCVGYTCTCVGSACGSCTPSCAEAACGESDGCGGICTDGACGTGELCNAGVCECFADCLFDAGTADAEPEAGTDSSVCAPYYDPCGSDADCCAGLLCDLTDLPTCDIAPGEPCNSGDLCYGTNTCLASGVCGM